MPAQPVCPYCRAKLFPHEVTNDECASCHGRLSAAVEWVPPARDKDEPAPAARDESPLFPPGFPSILANRPPPEAFAAVRQGITLLQWGVLLGLGFGAVAVAGQFATLTAPNGDVARLFLALGLFADVFQFMAALLIVVGVCLCCVLPQGHEPAKGVRSVIVFLVAAGIAGAPVVAFLGSHTVEGGSFLLPWLPVVGVALLLFVLTAAGATICFFQLLADLARSFDDRNLGRRFQILSVLSLGYAAGVFLTSCNLFMWASSGGAFSRDEIAVYSGADCGISLLIGAALAAWFVALLTRLRRLLPAPPGW